MEKVALREDLYQFTYTMCQKRVFLDYMLGKNGISVTNFSYISTSEFSALIVMMLVCVGSQIGLSVLLLKSFSISSYGSTNYEVDVSIHAVRLICCIVFHFAFGGEVDSALKLMKYSILHSERFERPVTAFMICFLQLSTTVIIEFVNIFNLCNQSKILDVIMNFLALGVLADFDDYFLIPFMNPKFSVFKEMEVPRKVYRSTKVVIPEQFQITFGLYEENEAKLKKYVSYVR